MDGGADNKLRNAIAHHKTEYNEVVALEKSGKIDGRDMNGGPVAIDLGLIGKQTRKNPCRKKN
jgi:hypothetical protein